MSKKNERIEGRGGLYYAKLEFVNKGDLARRWVIYRGTDDKVVRRQGAIEDKTDAGIRIDSLTLEAEHWINHTQSQQSEVRETAELAIEILREGVIDRVGNYRDLPRDQAEHVADKLAAALSNPSEGGQG